MNAVPGQSVYDGPTLAVDSTDKPAVAFTESDGTHDNVYVPRSNQ